MQEWTSSSSLTLGCIGDQLNQLSFPKLLATTRTWKKKKRNDDNDYSKENDHWSLEQIRARRNSDIILQVQILACLSWSSKRAKPDLDLSLCPAPVSLFIPWCSQTFDKHICSLGTRYDTWFVPSLWAMEFYHKDYKNCFKWHSEWVAWGLSIHLLKECHSKQQQQE